MWSTVAGRILQLVAPLCLLSGGLAALQSYQFGGGGYFFATMFSGLILFLNAVVFGAWIVERIHRSKTADMLEALVVGSLFVCCVLMLLGLLVPVPLPVVTIGLSLAMVPLIPGRLKSLLSLSKVQWLTFISVFVAAAFWSQENLQPHFLNAEGNVILHPWIDHFFHGRATAMFGTSSVPSGNFQISGQPLPTYHYASYMFAAAVMALSGAPSLSLNAAFLATFGVLISGLAAFVVVRLFTRDERTASLATLFILVVPDPSFFWLGNRWTSFFFFQQVGPAGSFAVATMVLSGIYFLKCGWLPALALLVMSAFFKIQTFVIYGPLFILAFIWQMPTLSQRVKWIGTVGLILGVLVLQRLLSAMPMAPTLTFSLSGAEENLRMTIDLFSEGARGFWNSALGGSPSYIRTLAVGIPLVLLSTYGLWLLPLLLWRKSQWPFLVLGAHLVVALAMGLNTGYGDPFEMIHKTFILPYFAISIFSATLLANRLQSHCAERNLKWVSVVSIAALMIPFFCGKDVQSAIAMAPARMNLKLPSGIYQCARWIQVNTERSAMVQFDHPDPFLAMAAVSDRRAFATYMIVNAKAEPPGLANNLNVINSALHMKFPEFMAEIKARGMDYFVLTELPKDWPTSGLPIVFQTKGCVILKVSL